MKKYWFAILAILLVNVCFGGILAEFITYDHSSLYGKSDELDYYLNTRQGMISEMLDEVRESPTYSVRVNAARKIIHIISSMEFHIHSQILEDKVLPADDAYRRHYKLRSILDSLKSLSDEQLETEIPRVGDPRKLRKPGELPRDVWAREIKQHPSKSSEAKPVRFTPIEKPNKQDTFAGRKVLARDNNIGGAPEGYEIPEWWENMPEHLRPPLRIVVEPDTNI